MPAGLLDMTLASSEKGSKRTLNQAGGNENQNIDKLTQLTLCQNASPIDAGSPSIVDDVWRRSNTSKYRYGKL